MKKLKHFIYLFGLFTLSCKAQNPKMIELSNKNELNYSLANIWHGPILKKNIYDNSFYVKVFEMEDSRATPNDFFEGYDGILSSLLISVLPDGDYYTNSKLFKIESILNPKVIEVKETTYPNFTITVEFIDAKSKKHTIIYEFKCE